jgi:TonB family protein
MSSLLYALNICTLAIWISFAGFGTVGLMVSAEHHQRVSTPEDPYDRLETIQLSEDFTTGDADPAQKTEIGNPLATAQASSPLDPTDTLLVPPEIPVLPNASSLPDVPEMPAPEPKSDDHLATPALKKAIIHNPVARSPIKASRASGTATGSTTSEEKTGNGGNNGGSGSTDANRLAGGRMQAPSYPNEARSKGQTGTVVVEFIVGEDGRVISAYAKSPSPWPLLNERAISAVLHWKFRPGAVVKFTRPISFKLN